MGCSEPELVAQICDAVLNAEHAHPTPGLWMLSFIEPNIAEGLDEEDLYPGGPSWLGGCLVEAIGPCHAARRAWEVGCNPGGQVAARGPARPGDIGPEWMDRLLDNDDMNRIPEPPGYTRSRDERRRHRPRS